MSGQNTNTKPTSDARRETARRNGAKSHGAVTPDGQERARTANLRHGLFARTLLLPGENPATFADFIQELYDEYLPADGTERAIVEEIAEAIWQRRRLSAIFAATLRDNVIRHSAETLDTDAAGCNAEAWHDLSDNSRAMDNHIRYEQILVRRIQACRNALADMRSGKRDPRSRFRIRPALGPTPVQDFSPVARPVAEELTDEPETAEPVYESGHFENARFEAERRLFVNRSQPFVANKAKLAPSKRPHRRLKAVAQGAAASREALNAVFSPGAAA